MKTQSNQSAVKEWLSDLPFTQQALLMLSLRGADGMPKHNFGKDLLHYMRDVVLNAAYPGYDGSPEGFMRSDYDNFIDIVYLFFKDMDSYPMHFLMHLIHAGEVIAFNHPNQVISEHWHYFYNQACKNFHMNPETKDQLNERLSK